MLIMGAVLLLLIGVADGVKTFCDATQPHITTQCFGSLGGTVEVLLPKTSQDDIYRLKKNNVTILPDRSQTTNIRYSFNVSTGMFTIKEFNRTDKGTYWMEVHDQSGTEISKTQFHLSIQGVKTFCDATQPHITTQCFGSLGGTVEVQLPTHSPHEHCYTLKKNKVPIVEGEIKLTDPRYSFNVSTGVFTIADLKKTDYDAYSLAAHNGVEIATKLLSIQGVKTFCDATQPNIITQCFGSLGGTVEVQLPKTSQDHRYVLKKNKVTITGNIRYSFNSDTKIFMIMDINASDGGTYSMEVLDKNEAQVKNTTFYLSLQGVETFCDATQPHITTQCFGSLGGTVEVQLPKTSQDDIYKLRKNNVPIVKYKSQTKNVDYSFNVSTGIFTINDINRTEDGTYSIEAQNRNGINLSNIQFHLSIQAPVSSPLLSRECLSRGQQRVTCSAGGDGLHYSWSLDGLPLNDPRLLSGPSSASDVTLEPGRSGLLTCSVRNNVSHAAANITLSVCDGVETFCDATQPNITTQCFGSLGGTVEVLLPKTSQDDIYKLKKNNYQILPDRRQTTNIRYSFNVITGMFAIKEFNRTDKGTYWMEVHDQSGNEISFNLFRLSIEAPVSSPLLSRECLSRGQQRVSCSAGGDGLHYSWSLDGLPLNDTRLLSGPSSASDVTLEPGRSGLLTCSVRNNVSHAAANITLSVCDGVKTFCDATQPNITTQCFGSLGGTVEVLLSKTSQDDLYKLKKNNVVILSDRSPTTNIRYSFNVSTGMFAIKEFNRTDKGTYSMEVHDQNGRQVSYAHFRLSIPRVKTFCDATQPHITTQCFGSLGGTVEVLLPTHSPHEHSYALKKNKVPIVEGEIKITDPRYSFNVSTGVFTIADLKKTDYDAYSLAAHNGVEIATKLLSIQGVKSFCNATQPNITTQCFGSLGGTVEVLLPKTSQDDLYTMKKNKVHITDNTRDSFHSDTKIFLIMDINASDGGTYSMEVRNKTGTRLANTNFNLSIQGVETFCNATQPHITTQCFGSLGGTVEVLLPKTSQDDIYKLRKNNVPIVKYQSQTKNVDYSFNVSTGIFTINDINRTEDDTYSIEAHNRNGIDLSNIQFHLSIQAPVSSPLLSRECLSRGQQRVSCSAGGDGLHYSWSLDGLPLNDTRLLSGPSSASDVTLEPGRSGLLTCSVRNNVSHAAANITLSVCYGVKTFCDATQPHIITQCFGSLGGTVEVLLPTHSPHEHSYALKKNKVPIVEGEIKIKDPRYSFNVSTGVFTIADLKKTDYEVYSIAAHNGIEIATKLLSIQGVKTFCDATQPPITTQCFGSLGGTVEVLLPAKTSQDHRYVLKKNNVTIPDNTRYSFSSDNKIFTITAINGSDRGAYFMELRNEKEVPVANTSFYLSIQGVKTFCDATQPHITTQCFGSLGGTVEVQLPKTSQDDIKQKKNNVPIVEYKSQTNNVDYSFNVSTGIFTINDINRTEDGTYSIEARNGFNSSKIQFNLSIQAPVSSPLLSRECLSRGQQRVSCSAGGDGLHYSWSLDGLPLNDTRLLSGPGSASDVTLEPGRSGLLSCSVRNNVSHAAANITLSVCYGLVPIIAASLSVMALLLIVALGVYCAKKHKTSKDTTEAEDVIYADVSVLQRRGQRREQGEGEGEVEYAAVRVAPGPRRKLETNVDECVYAQPRRKRP
ncbi:uncharacterized protein LOC132466436 [Gadus macrocephalus]|uniref:uncharacterized protein LOC132466436 n=1 Tax=Gadus macrocephalus TaxID=80720 RepID=UPI0028CB634A|nr:uncharacterized protein LOC132466436 [Gadus macrocephalus]